MRRLGAYIKREKAPALDICAVVAGKSKKQVQDKARNIIDRNKRQAERDD